MSLSTSPFKSIKEASAILSVESRKKLESMLEYRVYPSRRILLEAGDICRSIYFIEKGVIRAYYVQEDKVITSRIMAEGEAICSNASFFRQIGSDDFLETLEETAVYSISYQNYREALRTVPEISVLLSGLFEHSVIRYEERVKILRFNNSQKRIEAFRKQYPELVSRIPNNICASFLGITPQTFSKRV